MQALGIQYGTFYPMLTNFHVIDDGKLLFDNVAPADAFMVSPLFYPPGFMVGVNTFRGQLTVTTGFSHTATDENLVRHFMDLFRNELPDEKVSASGITIHRSLPEPCLP
jgi:NRPS condensation-like uncharacterized protein